MWMICFWRIQAKGDIGRVLKDSEGKVLIQFEKEVLLDSAVHAELLSFKEDILVAAASRWASIHSFVFELDSQLVVTWASNLSSVPWRFLNILRK